jgi:hypothetical protein
MTALTPNTSPASATRIDGSWPTLPYDEWKDTCATLHLWCQIVGKVRLVQTPWVNHSWHVPLYVSARGLTTSPIPHGTRSFEIHFDFIDHALSILASDGGTSVLRLAPMTVAAFHREIMDRLTALGLPVTIDTMPNEIADCVPFDQDDTHRSYDAPAVNRFWRILVQVDRLLKSFRCGFIGKCSPVHFFWGSFDLAVTRFSGRTAPPHPGGIPHLPDWVAREAYSHEVSSCGFWPGNAAVPYPAFYAYAYPEPPGFKSAPVRPEGSFYSSALGEFLLPYDAVRSAADPNAAVRDFAQTTYAAAADLAHWDRASLEASSPLSQRKAPSNT